MWWFRKKAARRKQVSKGFQGFTLRAAARNSNKAKPSAFRKAAGIGLVLLVLAAALVLAGMGVRWLAHELLAGNQLFHLDGNGIEIEVRGREITPPLVMEYAALGMYSNIFAIDLNKARSDFLRKVPQAKDISFSRKLPGTLSIKVTERLPVALITRNKAMCLGVDDEGIVLKASSSASLPVITGYSIAHPVPGMSLATNKVMKALTLLEKCTHQEWVGKINISLIDVARADRLVVMLNGGECFDLAWKNMDEGGVESSAALELKLHKMRELMRTAAANGHFIEHADLTLDRNIPVKHRNSAGRAQPGGRGHGL